MKLFLQILLIVAWVGLATGAILLMGFANRNHEIKPCIGMEITMDNTQHDLLFTSYDLKRQLTEKFGKFESKTIDQIDVERIITFLRKNPNIDKADAHLSIEGKLMIEVSQSKPLVRIISVTGKHYYIDEKGKLLPANPAYPARVVVANGNIPVKLKVGNSIYKPKPNKKTQDSSMQTLINIHDLAGIIISDSVLNALIEQIYVNPDGTISMVTKAGSHTVELGNTSDANEKLENLKAFYRYGLSKTGWQMYH
jgi:cell division protein FtsQ